MNSLSFEKYANGNTKVLLHKDLSDTIEISENICRVPNNIAYIKSEYIQYIRYMMCTISEQAENGKMHIAYDFSYYLEGE